MSPERINGQPYSFPADIWALVRLSKKLGEGGVGGWRTWRSSVWA